MALARIRIGLVPNNIKSIFMSKTMSIIFLVVVLSGFERINFKIIDY